MFLEEISNQHSIPFNTNTMNMNLWYTFGVDVSLYVNVKKEHLK